MTFDRITIPSLDHQEQNTLDVLLTQLSEKAGRNNLRAAYYDGKNAVRDLGISTPPNFRRIATVLGWSAKAVDLLNRRCRLETFYVPGLSADDLGLTQVWDDNFLATETRHAGLSSLIHSTAFVITTQGDTAAGEPEVLITAKSALSGTGNWNRRKRALDSFLSIIDTDSEGKPVEMVLYLDGVNVTMTRDGGWQVDRRSHAFGVPVDPLIYKGDLERPFGRSRISRAVMSLHDSAIRTVIRSEVSAEFYSVPQRVLLGADESAFRDADGNRVSTWQAVIGKVWAIPDDEDATTPRADIKEMSAATQQPHVDQLRAWAQLFAGETSIPVGSLGLGAAEANPTSAEAYGASREDIIGEAEDTTDGWSPTWRRSALRALKMLNGWNEIPTEFLGLAPKWRDPRNTSRAAAADAAVKTITQFPWMASSELGLELYGFDQAFLDRAKAELRKQRGAGVLQLLQKSVPVPVAADGNANNIPA